MDGEAYNTKPYPYREGPAPLGDEYRQEMERALRGGITDSNFINIWGSLTTDLGEGDNLSPREALLREAIRYTTQDRNAQHGEPEENFTNIAEFWWVYLNQRFPGNLPDSMGVDVDAVDVAVLMALMKIARLTHNRSVRDSWVDAAAYLACGWDAYQVREGNTNG